MLTRDLSCSSGHFNAKVFERRFGETSVDFNAKSSVFGMFVSHLSAISSNLRLYDAYSPRGETGFLSFFSLRRVFFLSSRTKEKLLSIDFDWVVQSSVRGRLTSIRSDDKLPSASFFGFENERNAIGKRNSQAQVRRRRRTR